MSEHNSDLEGQMAQRVERMDKFRARGINPFANDFVISEGFKFRSIDELPIQDAITNNDPRYDVAGRLLQIGDFGKIRFFFIRWIDGQMIQGLIRKPDNEVRFELAKDLQVGDIIGFRGPQFKTKQGRPAILIEDLVLLTKSIRPLPGKILQEEQDINDIELLYRRRYLDFIQHPEKIDVVKKRANIIKTIRRTLDDDGFIEVETRMMLPTNGGASARPFKTKHNTLDKEFNLRIAPELDLKRLVVGGMNRVYEIGRQFRNEGMDRFHNPEFTSLEFYKSYSDYEDAMLFTEHLIIEAARAIGLRGDWDYQGHQINLVNDKTGYTYQPFSRKTMLQAVLEVLPDLPADSRYGIKLVEAFEQHVEHTLIQPTFITQHPIESSPLARKNDDDPRFVDRFELFIAGKEIANGFSELNDPVDQYNRFADQAKQKAAGNHEAMEMDEDYIIALQYGLPPCSGVGIGIDRLVMLLTNQASIRDVILFPQMG